MYFSPDCKQLEKKISSVLEKRAYLKYSQIYDLFCRHNFPAFVITAFRAQMMRDDEDMALRAFNQLRRFYFHVYSPPLPSSLLGSLPFWYSHYLHLLQIRSRIFTSYSLHLSSFFSKSFKTPSRRSISSPAHPQLSSFRLAPQTEHKP